MTSTPVANAESDIAALRETAAGWLFFHDLFRFPTDAQWAWLHDPSMAAAWNLLATHLKAEVPNEMPLPDTRPIYEQTFLSTFEVGMPAPLCPLIESHWHRSEPAPKVLYENILFYKQFGLQLRAGANETADHLCHQSEFIYYLCLRESEWRQDQGRSAMADSCARGRADFLARHLMTWLPLADDHLRKTCPGVWTAHWLTLLTCFAAGVP